MPPKNKRQSAKKNKKKGKNNGDGAQPTTQKEVNPKDYLLPGGLPGNLQEYEDRRKKSIQASYTSVYTRYKKATQEFVNFMIQNTPEWVTGNRNSVDFLLTAADWMVENRFEIHPTVLNDLKLAIRLRKRAGESVFGGGDLGHKYFIDILVFCWSHLITLPRSNATDNRQDSDENQSSRNKNSYEVLMFDDEDEEDLDEETFPSVPVPRPERQSEQPWTIDDLMKSDDRTDSILFLSALDDFMGGISHQYKCIAKVCSQNRKSTDIVEDLLEAATLTSMTIQHIQQLEMEFMVDHEDLNTPYRMLSAIVLPEITMLTSQIVKAHGERLTSRIEQDVIMFLGDCMECTFRNKDEAADALISDFCQRYEINPTGTDEITNYVQGLQSLTRNEVPIMAEISNFKKWLSIAQSLGQGDKLPQPHTWLSNMEFIGRDRAIHHTLRLLQSFSKIIEDTPNDQKILNRPGFFGPSPFRPERVRKIHGDLDEYLMADILPQWFLMCRHGIIGRSNLPHEQELCPLFVLFRDYVQKPHKPVSWSLAFAVHALLTVTLDTAPVYNDLMSISDAVFHKYFQQLDHATGFITKEKDTRHTDSWAQNMLTVSFLKNLGIDTLGRKALWNPLCASTTLMTLTYFGNMEAGCALIDCRAQLRITLHLFHALKVRELIREGEIPILDRLNEYFKSSRGVWEGPLPTQGEFVKRFMICFGMSAKESKQMSEEARLAITSRMFSNKTKKSWRGKGRKMSHIEPSEISKSYRRICNRDFHDVVDKYHTDEQRARMKGTEVYGLAVRTNDTMDSIADESAFLSLNLPVVGIYLEQFVCSLFRVLQFDSFTDSAASFIDEQDRRPGHIMLFVLSVLGALDFAANPESYEFVKNYPVGGMCATFMNTFLNSIPADNVMWFQGTMKSDNMNYSIGMLNSCY